jgi:hypothetical protein
VRSPKGHLEPWIRKLGEVAQSAAAAYASYDIKINLSVLVVKRKTTSPFKNVLQRICPTLHRTIVRRVADKGLNPSILRRKVDYFPAQNVFWGEAGR